MANRVICCPVCSTREVQSLCICKFPLPGLCGAKECRDAHSLQDYRRVHTFLPLTAERYINSRNHRNISQRLLAMSMTHSRLSESLHLLDDVLVEIESTYQREAATLSDLKDEYIMKVKNLKEVAVVAFESAVSEFEQHAVNSDYIPQSDVAQWVCTEAAKKDDEEIDLFQCEIRKTQEEDRGLLFAVRVESIFKSLETSYIRFPVDTKQALKEEIERLKNAVAELEQRVEESDSTIKKLREELKNYENSSEKSTAGVQRKYQYTTDEEKFNSPSSNPLKVTDFSRNYKSPLFIDTYRSYEGRGGFIARASIHPPSTPQVGVAGIRPESAKSGGKANPINICPSCKRPYFKRSESGRQLKRKQTFQAVSSEPRLLSPTQKVTLTASAEEVQVKYPRGRYEKPPEIDLQEPFLAQSEELKSTDSLCKWKSESHNADALKEMGFGLRETKASDTILTAKQSITNCNSCGSRLSEDEVDFQCPNSCLCKQCSIEHVLGKDSQQCTYCLKNFSEEAITAIRKHAKRCHICGIALPHNEFLAKSKCDVCQRCVEVSGKTAKCEAETFPITDDEVEKMRERTIENACCYASESLFHSTLPCGHRVCKVHVNTLLVCRCCKSPAK